MGQTVSSSVFSPIVLNPEVTSNVESTEPIDKCLKPCIQRLQAAHVAKDGLSVDYASMVHSAEFAEYCTLASGLGSVDLEPLDEPSLKAFFINIYNALIIHALSDPSTRPTNIVTRYLMFSRASYRIGKYCFSLNDIENGVLRGNRPSPAPGASRPFSSNDPRHRYVLPLDHRIHFALNCGAKSCPPVRFFDETKLDQQLNLAARNFCRQEVKLHPTENRVTISEIFKWYKRDFGQTDLEVLQCISVYLDDANREKLEGIDRLGTGPSHQTRGWLRPFQYGKKSRSAQIIESVLLEKI